MTRLVMAPLIALLALAGCSQKGATGAKDAAVKDAAIVDAMPSMIKKRRRKITLPPPQPIPPRPAGEPTTADEFKSLSDSAAKGAPIKKPGAPPVQRIDAFTFRVGRVVVDRKKRTVEMPAKVNMTEGILEYIAVSSDGKLHESVLEVDAEPSHLHLAMLLMDMDPAIIDRSDQTKMPVVKTPGGKVKLEVSWTDKDTNKAYTKPIESWLYTRKSKKSPPQQAWSFQGGNFWNGRYTADMDRSVVGLVPDESVVITVGADAGNPYQGEMLGFEVFKGQIPAKGTAVTFRIVAADGKVAKGAPPPAPAPAPTAPAPVPTPIAPAP